MLWGDKMLTTEALKLLKPNENMMTVSVREGLVVVEFGDKWFAVNRRQAVELIQSLANAANSLA